MSTETGHQESLVWSWEWVWEWACSGTEANDSNAESGSRASPPAEAGPGLQASSAESDQAALEPWVWTWTFTFCGETRTMSTRGGTGTPLTWAWDWTWTWTCPSAAAPDAGPPPAIDVSPPLVTSPPAAGAPDGEPADDSQRALQLAEDEPAATLATAWLSGASLDVEVELEPELPAPVDLVISAPMQLDVAIPPVVLTVPTTPAIPFPAADDAAEPTTSTPARRTVTRQPRPTSASTQSPAEVVPHASPSEPRVHHARPVEQTREQTRAHDRSKRDRQQLPPERQQPRQALGSSSAGGIVPSALLFGFAALTGFIVLAAPGLGRRIRVARALRPQSPDQSPIEHPG